MTLRQPTLDRRRLLLVGLLWLVVSLLLLITFRPERDFALWWTIFDAAHLPVFGSMGWATIWAFRERRWPQTIAAVAFVAVLAAGTEGAQLFTGRDATLSDLLWNLAGGTIGVALGRAAFGARAGAPASPIAAALLGALALGLFAFASAPAVREVAALDHFRRAFPAIGDFETPIELVWWRRNGGARIARTDEGSATGRFALRVELGRGRYPGVAVEGRSFDWAGYDTLAFWVDNPGESFPLLVRVDDDGDCDEYEDRYNGRFVVPRGASRVAIPLARVETAPRARRMRLSRIRGLYVFAEAATTPAYFLIDDVRVGRAAQSASGR